MKMKIKKILSLSLVIAILFSFNTVGFAATNWLLEFNDYSTGDMSQWKSYSAQTEMSVEDNKLKVTNNTGNNPYVFTASTFDTTNMYGIEFNFDVKLFSTDGFMRIYYKNDGNSNTNSIKTLATLGSSGSIVKVCSTTIGNIALGTEYTCVLQIIFAASGASTVNLTIKDMNGNVVCSGSGTETLTKSATASILLDSKSALGAGFYLDNTSMREITADDMPISYTKVLQENFDSAVATETYVIPADKTEGYGGSVKNYGYSNNLYIFNGNGAKLTLGTADGNSTDKVLDIDISSATEGYLGVMYAKDSMNSELYYNEMTFKYTNAVTGVRVMNGGFGYISDLAWLDFDEDYIGIGRESVLYNQEAYDFVVGNTYTVRTYYTLTADNHTRVKAEITDGTTSAVVYGTITRAAEGNKLYPEYRFEIGNTPVAGDKIVIVSNNIYSGPARAVNYSCEYSNLAFNKGVVEAGEIKASVVVDSNVTAQNTVSGAKLIICSYASDGTLDGLKIQDISKVSGTYEASLNLTANAKKVKAMLWDMDCGKVTPIFANVTIGE